MFMSLMAIIWFQIKNLYETNKSVPGVYKNFIINFVFKIFRIPKWQKVEVLVFPPVTDNAEKKRRKSIIENLQDLLKREDRKRIEYTVQQLIVTWNDFVFLSFALYFILLNIVLLVIMPFFKTSIKL